MSSYFPDAKRLKSNASFYDHRLVHYTIYESPQKKKKKGNEKASWHEIILMNEEAVIHLES